MKSKSGKDHRRDKNMMEHVKANFEVDRNTRFYDVEFEGAKKANMTDRECEQVLLILLNTAWQVFKRYNPEGCHLDMFSTEDGHCVMGYKPSARGKDRIIDGYLSPSGDYRFSR